MNRRYTSGEYYEKCELLRKYFRHPALTTDVIVGFPGETEEEYARSKDFIEKVGFYETHVFKYSKREGTRAAVMENQVPESVKAKRSNELIELGRRKQAEYEETLMGTVQEVLIEEEILHEGERYQTGFTREYVKIGQKMTENRVNQIVNVEIKNRLQIMH
jgi:threonylcarbamoyladenosine tRNA methylthiotransferase MtaB